LKSLIAHLQEMQAYLQNVLAGKLPLNHVILSQIQDIFNLSPNLTLEHITKSFLYKTNDMLLTVYLASMIRSVLALHSLINNKKENFEAERKLEAASTSPSSSSSTPNGAQPSKDTKKDKH
jgi:26S proteasome regulatory subunit N8